MNKIIFLYFLFLTFLSQAQDVTVLDKETNSPLKNVAITNDFFNQTVYTNSQGKATTNPFKDNDILTFFLEEYIEFEVLKRDLPKHHYTIKLVKKTEKIDDVLIFSASKNAEHRKRLAEQIIVTSAKEIENAMPQTSADFLATIPSIKVQKTQFGGGSPVLRGMEANRVLLVVDGVRLNNAIYRKGHLQNAITVSPSSLEKTEVVYGPSSVLYGSDALGGVIHYYTKKPKTTLEPTLKTMLHSTFSTVNKATTSTIGVAYGTQKFATYTSFSHAKFGDLTIGKNRKNTFNNWGKVFQYSNNTNTYYNPNATINTQPNRLPNTGYSQLDFLQRVLIPLHHKADLNLNFQYSESTNINRFDKLNEKTNSNNLKFAEWYYGPQKRLLFSSQLHIKPEKKWITKGTITAAYQNVQESRIQRKFTSLDRSYRNESVDVFSLNGDFLVPLASKRILSYGFEVTHNDVQSISEGKTLDVLGNEILGFSNTFSVQSRYPDGGSTYTSASLYANYRQDIAEKQTLNTGIRFTDTYLKAKWVDNSFITLPATNISLNNSAVTATFGYIYKPTVNLQINANLASGFRSPNIDDVGKIREKNGNVTVPNIYLRPEYAYSAELGTLKYFNHKKFYIGFNMYYTLLNNYIIREAFVLNNNTTILYDGETANIVANVNKGQAYIVGSTLSFKGRFTKQWKTNGSITYTNGKTYDTKEPLSSIPPLFGNIGLTFVKKKFETSASMIFNAHKKASAYNISEGIDNLEETPLDNSNNYFGSPSWMTINYFANYKINSKIKLQFSVKNVFDIHYKEFASGISSPGRNFTFGAKIKI